MTLNDLHTMSEGYRNTERMPVLFLGHGSPMNAIAENEFVAGWRNIGTTLPTPHAILCISAHWETRGTLVTAMERPRTIHDFGGFPEELYTVQYPAPGHPALAGRIKDLVHTTGVRLDQKWGLDHGCWSVVKHLYPGANIPVVQMSLDQLLAPGSHYSLGAELAPLRNKGVLIVGSGNMVHNLRMVAWDRLNDEEYGYDWAMEASRTMKTLVESGDHRRLIDFGSQGTAFNLAIPTPEHYLPLLYALSLQQDDEPISFFNDKAVGGSLTMTSVKIG